MRDQQLTHLHHKRHDTHTAQHPHSMHALNSAHVVNSKQQEATQTNTPVLASCSMLANSALAWSPLLPVMGVTCSACCTGMATLWGLSSAAASLTRRGVEGLKASCSTNRLTCSTQQ